MASPFAPTLIPGVSGLTLLVLRPFHYCSYQLSLVSTLLAIAVLASSRLLGCAFSRLFLDDFEPHQIINQRSQISFSEFYI